MDNDLEKDKNGLPEGTSDINEEKNFDNLEKEATGNEEAVSGECRRNSRKMPKKLIRQT